MLDMLFLLAILGMLITRKQYTTQEVEKRSKKGTKRVVPIVRRELPFRVIYRYARIMVGYTMKIYGHRNSGKG